MNNLILILIRSFSMCYTTILTVIAMDFAYRKITKLIFGVFGGILLIFIYKFMR